MPPLETDIESAVRDALAGDEAAFERVVRAYHGAVWAIAYAMTGDRAGADDLTQETFLVVWTEISRLRAPGAFPMWIRTIARNLARNWLRSRGYRARLAERYMAEPRSEDAAQADAAILQSERRERILAALRTLSPRIRETMVLFYLEERPIGEIADALGLSETAVKSRLFQGRKRLRDALAAGWERDFRESLPTANPTAVAGRVMGGLALGPAAPEIGRSAAAAGWAMWHQETIRQTTGRALDALAQGGVAVSAKKAAALAAAALLAGAGAWVAWTQGERFGFGSGAVLEGTPMPGGAMRYGAVSGEAETDGAEDAPEALAVVSAAPEAAENTPPSDVDGQAAAEAAFAAALDAFGDTTVRAMSPLRRRIAERNRIDDEDQYASIAGHVIDLEGRPVADALVSAFTPGRDPDAGPMGSRLESGMVWRDAGHRFTAVTDAAGAYRIEGIAYEGTVHVGARKPGYIVNDPAGVGRLDIQPGDAITGIDFILEPGVTLYGKVLDPSGKPIAGAQVFCVGIRSGGGTQMGLVNEGATDASGAFYMTFDREGVLTLEVVAAMGQTTFAGIAFRDGDAIELVMEKPASMEGTITHRDGKSAAGVNVVLGGYWAPDSGRHRAPASVLDGVTDAQGYYRVDGVDPGASYAVTILDADGKALTAAMDIDGFAPGEARIWDYTFAGRSRVAGTVYGQQTGQPLRDIMVAVRRPGDARDLREVFVNADGTYAIDILEGPGEYHVYPRFTDIDPNEHGYPSGEVIDIAADEERALDLTMIDPVSASVRAVDPSGTPMANLDVGVWEAQRNRMPVARTDADGRYEYHGFAPTVPIAFEVRGPEGQRAKTIPQTGEPGAVFPEQTVVMYRTGGIQGRAVDAEGQPLARVELRIWAEDGAGYSMYVDQTTDENGYFTVVNGLPAAEVRLTAECDDPATEQPLTWNGGTVALQPDVLNPVGTMPFAPVSDARE